MENQKDATAMNAQTPTTDDIDQVRQLLLGNKPAEQERQIAELRERVSQLEKLVHALVAHGDANHRRWQNDVASLTKQVGRETSDRSSSAQITPLTPRSRDADQDAND